MSAGAGGRFPVEVDDAAAAAGGLRLDAFVARSLGMSATAARRLIAAGLVRVDGRPVAKGARVAAGAVVTVAPWGDDRAAIAADPALFLVVVYEDAALVAIDKPAGMPSHPLRAGERGTAANGIVARWPDCAGASLEPREGGLGHRLDTATSGVLIAARSRTAWLGLRRALGAEDCEKRYLAEVRGQPPDTGVVAADIGRRGRRGGTVRTDGGGRRPQAAETWFTVLGRGADTALIEARLHAGRAHQVRAHLAAAGFPIVGDDRYGDRYDDRYGGSPGVEPVAAAAAPAGSPAATSTATVSMATKAALAAAAAADVPTSGTATSRAPAPLRLHAASVSLRHPVTGAPLVIAAPPPAWARPFGSAARSR